MALKYKIDKATFDKLSDTVKAEYVEKDGEYVLDVDGLEGLEDTGALRRARDREVASRKAADAKARELAEELEQLRSQIENEEGDKAAKSGDIEKLQKQWDDKFAKLNKESSETINALRQRITGGMVSSTVEKLAAELSDSPKLLLPHLASRISADFGEDGEPVLKFRGAEEGSELDYDGLKKEFLSNKDFAAILRGNQSRGAGGANADGKGRPVGRFEQQQSQPLDLSKATPQQIAAHIAAKNQAAN